MKVEQSQVTKLVITGVNRHDPIHVYLEDFGENRGQVTINESNDSYSYYWGSMGCSLVEFLLSIDNDYWIMKLAPNLYSTIDDDNDANIAFAKKQVSELHKDNEIDKEKARYWWNLIERSDNVKRDCCDYYVDSELLELFGDDAWYNNWPSVPNPEYARMEGRLNAVREAIKQIKVEHDNY
ncbi:hypothetical protein [Providencia sp. PROV236]|uniref:hypothetical protein n=1 Tax=Providencia sp. PROV236 TaxID=2936798 RepID=UPI0034E2431F